MRSASAVTTTRRLPWRAVALGLIVVVSAMAGLALLAEAMSGDGGTVYLANIQPGSSDFAAKPSIVVTGIGHATAPAEWATLQLVVGRSDESFGSGNGVEGTATPAEQQRALVQPIVDAIVAQEVPAADIHVIVSQAFSTFYCIGPGCETPVRIDVTIEQPTLVRINTVLHAAGAAANEIGLRLHEVAAGYTLADCTPLAGQARERAIADAKNRAAAQAAALGVGLGDSILASEPAPTQPTDETGCQRPVRDEFTDVLSPTSQMVSLLPFDPAVEPETTVEMQVSLAYAIDGANGSGDSP